MFFAGRILGDELLWCLSRGAKFIGAFGQGVAGQDEFLLGGIVGRGRESILGLQEFERFLANRSETLRAVSNWGLRGL